MFICRRIIAVTKGAIATFSEEELKAILSHEIAHILNRDTAVTLYALVGNGIFMLLILPIKLLCAALASSEQRWAEMIGAFFGGMIAAFLFLMQIAMSFNGRKSERRADMFTVKLGYGDGYDAQNGHPRRHSLNTHAA